MGNKHTCGISLPSSCVPWVGGDLTSFDIRAICAPSVEEVILKLDSAIGQLQKSLDISQINTNCHPALGTANEWHEVVTVLFEDICIVKQAMLTLQVQLSQFNIGNIPLNISLGCLAGECSQAPLSIAELFGLLINKYCYLSDRIEELAPSTAVSGNLLYQPH